MKRYIFFLLLSLTLTAEEPSGEASVAAVRSSEWQNWMFAAGAIGVATVSLLVVALDSDRTSSAHE